MKNEPRILIYGTSFLCALCLSLTGATLSFGVNSASPPQASSPENQEITVCPTGQTVVDKKCVPNCPSGFTLRTNNGVTVCDSNFPPICPDGYVLVTDRANRQVCELPATRTPSPYDTPGGPQECDAWAVAFEWKPGAGSGAWMVPTTTDPVARALQLKLFQAYARCSTSGVTNYTDDCVRSLMVGFGDINIPDASNYALSGFPLLLYGVHDIVWSTDPKSYLDTTKTIGSYMFLYSAAGFPLSGVPSPATHICIAFVMIIEDTPVSLVWEKGANPNESVRMVDFPVDPSKVGKIAVWKASKRLPLVVYDPTHSGIITSGYQLFGRWTFGGRKLASKGNPVKSTTLWRDGYEALASLDLDGDNALRGDELRDLGLWFDENQDGVSQPGEVKRLADVDVTAIFVKPDRTDPETRDIHASLGFERTVDGVKETGASVDWFSGTSESNVAVQPGDAATKNEPAVPATLNESKALVLVRPEEADISGVWRWTGSTTEEGRATPSGFFSLREYADNQLKGTSYGFHKFARNEWNLGSAVTVSALSGFMTGEKNGDKSYTWELKAAGGVSIVNTVRLTERGTKLIGTSTGSYNQNGAKKETTYAWTAVRIEEPAPADR